MLLFILHFWLATGLYQQSSSYELNQLSWLLGEWQRKANDKTAVEQWTKVSDNTFEGLGFSVQNGDTTVTEYLRLEQFGDEVFFTARVKHNKYPVSFRLNYLKDQLCVFENPEHDFPQRIRYHLKQNRLHARVESGEGEKLSGLDFVYNKNTIISE